MSDRGDGPLTGLQGLPIRITMGRTFPVACAAVAFAAAVAAVAIQDGRLVSLAETFSVLLRSWYGTRGRVGVIHAALGRIAGGAALVAAALAAASLAVRWLSRSRSDVVELPHPRATLKWGWGDLGIATSLTFVAAVLRAPGLDQSLWLDELGQWYVFIKPGVMANVLPRVALGPQPLLQWLGLASASLLGDTEVGLRFPVFLLSVASVPLLYFTTARMASSRAAGLLAGALLAAHSYHIHYSFQFRAYGVSGFLSILSTTFWLRYLGERKQRLFWAYVAATTALLYAHLYNIVLVGAQIISAAAVAFGPMSWKQSVAPIGRRELLSLVAMITWGLTCSALLYGPYAPVIAMGHLGVAEHASVSQHAFHVLGALHLLVSAAMNPTAGAVLVAVAALSALWCGRAPYARLLGLQAVSAVLITLFLPPGGSGFQGRYLFPIIPILVTAVASTAVGPGLAARGTGAIVMVAISVATLHGRPAALATIQPYREAVQTMLRRARPDAVLAANSLGKDLVQYYSPAIVPLEGPDHLRGLTRTAREVWVLSSFEMFPGERFQSDAETQRIIERELVLDARLPGQVPVTLWRTRAGQ